MSKRLGKIHCIIPDAQIQPGDNFEYLRWVGNYIAEKRPDVVVNLGDFGDMPSLNPHGRKFELEGKRYKQDIEATRAAMKILMAPFQKVKGYDPKLVFTMGNHEERIDRYALDNPQWKGFISSKDLGYTEMGWKVIPFLKPARIHGINYAHYFISGSMGRPVSSAQALLKRVRGSAVMGHVQSFDMAIHPYTGHLAMFAGACNLHNEDYLTPQGNNYRRQIVFLHEVHDGIGDPMLVSLRFLKAHYS